MKHNTYHNFQEKSFTLIELVIVIAIIGAISVIGITNLFNYRSLQNLKNTTQEIVAVLRNAQNRSMSQELSNRWGVYFSNPAGAGNDFFELFSGTNYNPAAVASHTVLSSGVQFDVPAAGASTTIIFSPLTGFPDTSTAVRISLTNNPLASSTITINSNGQIQY